MSDADIIFTQRRKLLDHLKSGLPITAHKALIGYGISRLAPRIFDLKKAGFQIERRMIPAVNREGKRVLVAEYRLVA